MRSRRHSHRFPIRHTPHLGEDDGLDPRQFFDRRTAPTADRKTLQLCRQVARALHQVLAESPNDLLRDLVVESVVPAPNARRLMIAVSTTATLTGPSQLLAQLNAASPWLRAEMAAAICRKRAPELAFTVLAR